jgi:N-acetylglucosamine-6-phosphate deacetylase
VRIHASLVVTPGGVVERGEVVVDGGRIASVRALPAGAAGVPERVLCPGFVDLQVNGIDDVDCASASTAADWDRLVALNRAGGATTWCPTLVTAPLDAYAARLERVAAAMGRHRSIAGAHLEGPFLGGAPGAHPRHLLQPAVDLRWLDRLPVPPVRVVTLAPELDGALEAARLLAAKGVLVAMGHSTATYDEALAGAEAGARLVTHLFNGMGSLHHRAPGLVGAALADERLVPSLIADGVHVHPAVLGLAARAKAVGGWVLVTDAVAWRSGIRLAEGEVRLVDGGPRLPDGTLAGSALTMAGAVARMVRECGVPLADAVRAASTTPADLLGLADRGRLAPGAAADLVLLREEDLGVEDVLVLDS